MMKAKDYRRINFQLPLSLAREFELAAQKEGVTKAKLLRRWINSTDNITFSKYSDKSGVKSFNLRVDPFLCDKLQSLANTYQVSHSVILRQVIQQSLNLSLPSKEDNTSLQELWNKGLISQLIDKTKDIPSYKLDFEDRLLIIKALTDMGEHLTAWDQLIALEEDDLSNINLRKVGLHLNKAALYLSLLKIDEALNTLNTILPVTISTNNRYYISRNYYLLGKLYATQERISQAIDYYQKALLYLDVINYPLEVGLINLRMQKMYLLQSDMQNAGKYLALAEELITLTGNPYYRTCLANEKTSFLYLHSKLNEANTHLIKAHQLNIVNNSSSQDFYSTELTARISLVRGDNQLANDLFNKAAQKEEQIKGKLSFSKVKLMQAYLRTKTDYKSGINYLNEKVNLQLRPIRKNWGQYLLASAMYINAPTDKEQKVGARRLKEFVDEGNVPLLIASAKKTLITNRLQPI